jgi:hypothetical protein
MRLLVPALLPRRRIPRRARPARRSRRARLAVLLFPPLFVAVLCAAWAGTEAAVPAVTDPDCRAKLDLLRQLRSERPNAPVGVVLGSSRLVWGFRPDALPAPAAGARVWFNGAHVGAGPALQRIAFARLLRDGARPDAVAVEVMPTFLANENARFVCGHVAVREYALARRYFNAPITFDYNFARLRLARAPDLARALDPLAGVPAYRPLGTHPTATETVTADERQRRTAEAHKNNALFLQRPAVRPAADRALRDLLSEAQAHGVRAVLVRTPEGATFRSWHPPERRAELDAYVRGLATDFAVPVIDARDWLEEGAFYDSHHMLRGGADAFTVRFVRELEVALRDR